MRGRSLTVYVSYFTGHRPTGVDLSMAVCIPDSGAKQEEQRRKEDRIQLVVFPPDGRSVRMRREALRRALKRAVQTER
ncbi:hypothetical protein AAFF_G00338930 [Aldrovandia affinis]|uniref:Uncharacterized protein n=1 Tax=Aldrovandia affinis TaxID=143900 RepID=A0AAD7R6C0_9TELE|nr:hypothetical protein AAFF_G00338930 [Aldrovandia affinis]